MSFSILYLIVLLPIFLLGALLNYPAFKVTGQISKKFVNRGDFRGSLQLATGLLVFLLFYSISGILAFALYGKWMLMLTVLLSYPSGLFSLKYAVRFYRLKSNWKFIKIFTRDAEGISELSKLREEIIEELEKGKATYVENQSKDSNSL
ncbi:MAG: hypothetical protein HRT72_13285 [Flavobacteriales bacterium]|nr:hypothetical protein [Flavobacteriales bacterium]